MSFLPRAMRDLAGRMLSFVPHKRCTMQQAMTHPAFAHHHTPENELPEHSSSIRLPLSDWKKYSITEYKAEIEKVCTTRPAKHGSDVIL